MYGGPGVLHYAIDTQQPGGSPTWESSGAAN